MSAVCTRFSAVDSDGERNVLHGWCLRITQRGEYHAEAYRAPTIVKLLTAKERGMYAFSKGTGGVARCAGSGRPTKIKITNAVKEIVESEMRADDERTVKEFQKKLAVARQLYLQPARCKQ